MAETWFFNMDGDNVRLRSQVQGDGMIGDAFSECAPGGSILNLSYADLASRKSGRVTITDGVARIEPQLQPVEHNPFAGTR
jgi:hypothetical protein